MKTYLYFSFSLFLLLQAYAQVSTSALILNEPPAIADIQTYSRYDSSTDNLAEQYLFICIGEENRAVYLRIIGQDNNHYTEISQGGNLSFKIVSLVNGSQVNISSFGDSFKEPLFESTIGIAQLSYTDNITLSETNTYSILANITDAHNASAMGSYNFTINNTNCYRIEQNVSLEANQTYTIRSNFTEISLIIDDNITGKIIITEYNHSPTGSTPSNSLDRFVTVDITGPIKNVTVNLTITLNYTDAEVAQKGLDESTLQLCNWNGAGWDSKESTISSLDNTVTFIVIGTKEGISDERLGTFCIRGSPVFVPFLGGGGRGDDDAAPPAGGGNLFKETEEQRSEEEDDAQQEEDSIIPEDTPADNASVFKEYQEDTEGEKMIHPSFIMMILHEYCFIIIIILLLLWIITLLLLIRERKKRRDCEKERKKSETSELQIKEERSEKERMIEEKAKAEETKREKKEEGQEEKNEERKEEADQEEIEEKDEEIIEEVREILKNPKVDIVIENGKIIITPVKKAKNSKKK